MVASAKPNPFKEPFENASSQERDLAVPQNVARLIPGMRLLVVDPDPATAALVREALGASEGKLTARRPSKRSNGTLVFAVASLAEANQALKKFESRGEQVDLIVAETEQPDGKGLAIAQTLMASRSETSLLLTSRKPSLDGSLDAFRRGALDYLPKPLDAQTLAHRLRLAAARRYLQIKDRRRLERLKSAVRQLNQARRTVGQKVDLLCQDLVGAYSDLSKQLERVRVGEHLRKLLDSAGDLEQLLCHTMDWLLRELGHCNIAIFLTDEAGKSELGAYMKHTIPGEAGVTRWLTKHIIPRIAADGFLHTGDGSTEAPGDSQIKSMLNQTFMAVDCNYLAESLGTLIVFRKSARPFSAEDLGLLKAAGPVFATALTNLVRAGESPEQKQQDSDDEDWWRRSA